MHLALLHSERAKFHRVLAVLSAIGLNCNLACSMNFMFFSSVPFFLWLSALNKCKNQFGWLNYLFYIYT